ncbi:hypothetical protein D049_4657B, partial [Vibrio parahaemolyticus VPTS-2010]
PTSSCLKIVGYFPTSDHVMKNGVQSIYLRKVATSKSSKI